MSRPPHSPRYLYQDLFSLRARDTHALGILLESPEEEALRVTASLPAKRQREVEALHLLRGMEGLKEARGVRQGQRDRDREGGEGEGQKWLDYNVILT